MTTPTNPTPAPECRPPGLLVSLSPCLLVTTLAAATAPLVALLILLVLDRAFVVGALRIALVLLLVALAAALALLLLWLLRRAQRAALVPLQHGQPVHLRDLPALTQATAAAMLERHYAVELARAERSMFPALAHYSVHTDGHAALAAPVVEGEVVAAPAAAEPALSLAQLQARGHVGAGRALLVGYGAGAPLHIEMRGCGFIAVGGQTRSGKTTSVALLVSQAALLGWDIALCDPFPNKADGLLSLCRPLSGACFRQAATPDEIAQAIRLVDKIGRRRLDGERWNLPLLLVIEEFSNLVIRRMLPPAVLDLLPAMAMAYAAVGVHAILIGHEFSRALLGEKYGATLRRACTHRLAHRLTPDAAEFLLPSASYARQVVELQPGRALFWGDEAPALISVPRVNAQDLQFAAQGRPPRPYAPRPAPLAVAPPAPAPPPQSIDDRIAALLATDGTPRDSNAIAAQLGADLQQVRNALTRLAQAGRVARHGTPRNYTYSAGAP